MSFLSRLFGSDGWKQIERDVKSARKVWQPQIERLVKALTREALDFIIEYAVAERARREIK